jgi:hypothetical protein
VTSPDLAAELAVRLNEVAPDGFTVEAENTYVTVRHLGESVGSSGAAEFMESIEGIQDPADTLQRAAWAVLDAVQDYFADISTEPWPDRQMSGPFVQLIGNTLEMWFGERDDAVLTLRPLDVADLH